MPVGAGFTIDDLTFPVFSGTGGSTPPGTPTGDLAHSPADILRHVLIDLGIGTLPTDGGAWPIATASEPGTPDAVITTYDTQGRSDGRSMIDGEGWQHYGVQVRVRAATHIVAYPKAKQVEVAVDQSIYDHYIAIDGTTYLVHSVSRTSGVISIGKDTPNSKRTLFTINCLVSVHSLEV